MQLRALFQIQQLLAQQLLQPRQTDSLNETNNNDNESLELSIQIDNQNGASHTSSSSSTVLESSRESSTSRDINTGDDPNNRDIIIDENSITSGSTRIDLQLFTRWLEQAAPFVILLLILWLYQHKNGIMVFLWNSVTFMHGNQTLKKQVSLKEKRKAWILGWAIVGLSCHIFFMYFFFRSDELWRYLILLPPKEPLTIWNAFWIIVMNDFIVRFFTMIIKALTIIAVGHRPPFKRNAQLYTVIEMFSHSYRHLLPIPIWFRYFYMVEDNGHVFSSLMAGLYLAFKVTGMFERFRQFFATVRAYIMREVQYGKYATPEQVAEAGDMCAICQEKMASPIVLRCAHMFCEDCVTEWFERERSCPLCRAAVMTAGNRTHSDGTTSVLVQLF